MTIKVKSNGKTRINLRIPSSLDEWVKKYAKETNTNLTKLVVDFLTELRKKTESDHVPQL